MLQVQEVMIETMIVVVVAAAAVVDLMIGKYSFFSYFLNIKTILKNAASHGLSCRQMYGVRTIF